MLYVQSIIWIYILYLF